MTRLKDVAHGQHVMFLGSRWQVLRFSDHIKLKRHKFNGSYDGTHASPRYGLKCMMYVEPVDSPVPKQKFEIVAELLKQEALTYAQICKKTGYSVWDSLLCMKMIRKKYNVVAVRVERRVNRFSIID